MISTELQPDHKTLRNFALIMTVALALLAWILLPSDPRPLQYLPITAALLVFLLLGIFASAALKTPYRYWMKFGHVLSIINSTIILGIVFLLMVMPMSLVLRLVGKDLLRLRKISQESYREKPLIVTDFKVSMEHPY